MKRVCTILGRGGSKGVKNKNIRLLGGQPLICYSIKQAQTSGLFDAIAVSSDSEEILKTAADCGVKFLVRRPPELASDQAPKIPAIRHCLLAVEKQSGAEFPIVVDLDPTSPLRNVEDIRAALKQFENSPAKNLITAMPARRSPYFNLVEPGADGFVRTAKKLERPAVRRQDAPPCYDMNASIYIWRREVLVNQDALFNDATMLYVMPEERSIDIDSELDFEFVNFLMAKKGGASGV